MKPLAAITVAILFVSGCANYSELVPEERLQLEHELSGRTRDRYLRLSFYVTPFFGDAAKKLLTDVPPELVRLLDQPNGTHISPGPVEKIIPVGTRVRITQVEFPTAWTLTERVVYTPRSQPWIYLEVANEPTATPYIVVLRPGIKTRAAFLAEVERYVTEQDPAPMMANWSESARSAARAKTAVIDLPADALEVAWGYPEIRRISYEGSVRKEDWVYPANLRVAHLADGRLVSLEGDKH